MGAPREKLCDREGAKEYYHKVLDLSPGYDLARQALLKKKIPLPD